LHNYARVIEAERFVKMYEMQEQFGDDLPFWVWTENMQK
jgi:hypothetical protein